MKIIQRLLRLLRRPAELQIPGLQLLQTFDVGGQLVRRLHQFLHLRVCGGQGLGKVRLQLRRQHPHQLAAGDVLHLLVGIPDGGIIVLDGGGQIPGEDLAGVVVQGRHRHRTGVHLTAEAAVADHRQRMGQHCHLMAVLLNVLRLAVTHQRPAGDEPHPGRIGKKVFHVMSPLPSGYRLLRL